MNSIEIFSGAGGLAKGLEMAGVEHKALVEWNIDACNTLRKNYGDAFVFQGDIRNFDFADYKNQNVDIIAGGPPCQPFSLGGKSKGYDDCRDMFPSAVASIRTLMPKAFIFENVKGLLRDSFKEYFNYIILQLSYPEIELKSIDWRDNLAILKNIDTGHTYYKTKYNVSYQLVNAADYGVPQKRERVIIVGFRDDLQIDWEFPAPTHCEDSLLWDKYVSGEYWTKHNIQNQDEETLCKIARTKLLEKYGMWKPELKPWQTIRDAFDKLSEPDGQEGEHCLHLGAKTYPGHTGSNIDEPSKTIKAGSHGVPGGENMVRFNDGSTRYFSVLEAKRIQTFPDDYVITGAWTEAMRQLGNAVPVKLAHIVGRSVANAVRKASK